MATKKKTSPKKTPKKNPKKTQGASPRGKNKKAAARTGGQGSAFLVLLIMVLLTVIVLMAGDYIAPLKKSLFTPEKKKVTRRKEIPDRAKKVTPEKKEKKEKKEVISKEVKKQEPEKAPAPQKVSVKVYFIRVDDRTEKIFLAPVRRRVDESKKIELALAELLKGMSGSEKRKGYLSAIPASLKVRRVRVRNGIAEIDFNSVIGSGAGNILVSRLDQIVYTATQFKEVKAVQVIINGRRRTVLGSDGLSIGSPLHRRK